MIKKYWMEISLLICALVMIACGLSFIVSSIISYKFTEMIICGILTIFTGIMLLYLAYQYYAVNYERLLEEGITESSKEYQNENK